MERTGQGAGALWRKNDKQIKGKKEGRGGDRNARETGKGEKRRKAKGGMHGEGLVPGYKCKF